MIVFHAEASPLQNPPTFFRHGRLMPPWKGRGELKNIAEELLATQFPRDGFRQAGALIAGVGHRTALIQEGGYLCEALPRNLTAFLAGMDG
jgi:hypothetical protein